MAGGSLNQLSFESSGHFSVKGGNSKIKVSKYSLKKGKFWFLVITITGAVIIRIIDYCLLLSLAVFRSSLISGTQNSGPGTIDN